MLQIASVLGLLQTFKTEAKFAEAQNYCILRHILKYVRCLADCSHAYEQDD